jgi:ribosomal protein L11 methyltransferase
MAPMFVWSKRAAATSLEEWEDRFQGVEESHFVISGTPNQPTIRLEVYCQTQKEAETIRKQWGGAVKKLKIQNWAALAPPPPGPIKIRNRLIIVAQREKKELEKLRKQHPGRELISVPPDMAFGTGHHATTATVLRFVVDVAEKWQRESRPWTVLDLGCGSAILGIAARKLGAESVWGCDFDAQAVRVARENAVANQTDDLTLEVADVLKWKPEIRYDLVIANIFANILNSIFPKLVRSVKPDGIVMISGILHTQAEECLAAGRAAGLQFDRVVKKGRWVSAQGRLKRD